MKNLISGFVAIFILSSPVFGQYALQFGSSVAIADNDVLVGEGRNLLQPGTVFVYSLSDSGDWMLSASLNASDAGAAGDGFGRSISTAGNLAAIAAPDGGAVYIFEKVDGQWVETAKLVDAMNGFGSTVATDGQRLVVGAPAGRTGHGSVKTYLKSESGDWEDSGSLMAQSPADGDGYGSVVAIQNDNLIVGSPGANERMGLVYTYRHNDNTGRWEQADSLYSSSASPRVGFGSALYLAGSHLIVGAPGYENGIGAAAIYKFDEESSKWSFVRRVAPFDAAGGERFGSSLAFGDGVLLVGSPGYDARSGATYMFEVDVNSGRMASVSTLPTGDLQFRSSFGSSLASSDDVVAVGTVGYDNFEGAAFLYHRTQDGWSDATIVVNNTGEFASVTGGEVKCEEGEAGSFTCSDVDMLSFLSREDVGADRGIQMNDVWGWTDPATNREYAIVGRTDGTSFIDLTDAYNPVYLGDLPKTATANQSLWRDIKVYKDHAFIVADGAGAHHLQIFDLTQLRDVANPPQEFVETAIYKGIYSSHNIAINEETGFAYAVGSDSGGETCGGSLHMINVQDPANPTFAGCFNDPRTGRGGSGATHDTQCVVYKGPDTRYNGREICLSSNGTALSIADVTDKSNPVAISIADYPNVAYTHQGWLTDDHRYFYLNDEGDEVSGLVDATRTIIFDLTQLDDPTVAGEYKADNNAIDHNLYVKGNLMYQANYSAGLRIIDISDPENPSEVAYFDTVPYGENNNAPVLGAWSNYPYFESGVIVVTSGREGVFFLKKKEVEL